MTENEIAKACHEVNRVFCLLVGDESQVAWEDAPDWLRESVLSGVRAVLAGNNRTPRYSHTMWMEEKALEGWTYGPVKDPEKKEHPCMVPYDRLPSEQKAKDGIFMAVAQGLGGKL